MIATTDHHHQQQKRHSKTIGTMAILSSYLLCTSLPSVAAFCGMVGVESSASYRVFHHHHHQTQPRWSRIHRRGPSSSLSSSSWTDSLLQGEDDGAPCQRRRLARLAGFVESRDEAELYRAALERHGFTLMVEEEDNNAEDTGTGVVDYRWNPASGMLQMVPSSSTSVVDTTHTPPAPPRWIPVFSDKEHVLVKNGWSFLDADESEALSAFDVDAANAEGLYRPQWGRTTPTTTTVDPHRGDNHGPCSASPLYSTLGYSLDMLQSSTDDVRALADHVLTSDLSRRVLLEGATDPPGRKRTHNGHDFTGSVAHYHDPSGNDDHDDSSGVFVCALGGLPVFATTDLAGVATVASGWLSFVRPLSEDHERLVPPESSSLSEVTDQRVEVVCARTGCHLGHYFAADDGGGSGGGSYCINASALNFINFKSGTISGPLSYPSLLHPIEETSSIRLLQRLVTEQVVTAVVLVGAGCFWHVEAALRRLPGVVATCTGYAGGTTPSPSYKSVCGGSTGHAEVVRMEFDPEVLDPERCFDCVLALHDPTKVRAHGTHAADGQYRSCLFLPTASPLMDPAKQALQNCQDQLKREVVTQLETMDVQSHFYRAEDRHQGHDERQGRTETTTLDIKDWLDQYGVRSASVWGSSETIAEGIEETRLMI